MSLGQIADEVLKLVKHDGFNKDDAMRVITITKDLDTADRGEARNLQRELKDIYTRNFKATAQSRKGLKP